MTQEELLVLVKQQENPLLLLVGAPKMDWKSMNTFLVKRGVVFSLTEFMRIIFTEWRETILFSLLNLIKRMESPAGKYGVQLPRFF
jgi:hypothetical protein